MKVNLYKLIIMLLPTFIMSDKVSELIRAMLLQIEYAFNGFNSNVPDWLYKLNTNASVICLEHHIKRELDVDAVITELDGTPIDFLVTITGFVDENRLRYLIESYKLGGKSYVFQVGNTNFTAEFTNFVCESYFSNNHISLSNFGIGTQNDPKVISSSPVKSDITVKVQVTHRDIQDRLTLTEIFGLDIPLGSSTSESLGLGTQIISISIISVTPVSDNFFNYIP